MNRVVFLGLLAVVGCRSVPEELVVDGQLPGTYWEITAFEGPAEVRGPFEYGDRSVGHLDATVFMVELERKGWGELVPWSWLGEDRAYSYYIRWSAEYGSARTNNAVRHVAFWRKPAGVLSDPELTARLLIDGNGDADNDRLSPNCGGTQAKRAAENLERRILAARHQGR